MSRETATRRSPLARARGLGSAHEGVGHWIAQRVSAIALVPLTAWFVISVIANVGESYAAMRAWLDSPLNATLLALLIVAVFHHAWLGLQVVIEDYVGGRGARTAWLIGTKLVLAFLGAWALVSVLFVATAG